MLPLPWPSGYGVKRMSTLAAQVGTDAPAPWPADLAGAPQDDPGTPELSASEYALFAGIARPRSMRAGEVLFGRGDLGTTMYIIASGQVELDFGEDLVEKTLGPREFFGELGLLIGDHARSATACARADGQLLEVRHEEFQRLVDARPDVVAHFLRRAIARVVLNEQFLIRRLRRRNTELQGALDSLRAANDQLTRAEAMMLRDELTGLFNRRGLRAHLQERERNGATGGLGLLLVDCDGFKQINDEHGHVAGDRVLQGVASILRSVSGANDIACRLGGDEFALLFRADGGRAEVLRYADFIAETARGLQDIPQSPPRMCALSIGASLLPPGGRWSDGYGLADTALYRAKRLGGNRVEWQDATVATE